MMPGAVFSLDSLSIESIFPFTERFFFPLIDSLYSSFSNCFWLVSLARGLGLELDFESGVVALAL
jgi:hypothetical protein